uniref:Cell death abnormality protein 1-like isoform X2 n=1 Tax=Crassostrea virginica TaxID=6565 RepID=A0A8B8BWT7_CRAVI|nr:cell death abnormality protein 1-like isoform X2 [Crassostrea virginica]
MWIFSLIIGIACSSNTFSFAFENIALQKPTYQEHQYLRLAEALTQASNAVDELKSNLRYWGAQCVISENDQMSALLWVNLTSILSIHHINIYFRTENKPLDPSYNFTQRALGFSVYVSNTTNRSEGTLCFKDTRFTQNTIPAVFNTTCPVRGQYVIYYNERLPGVKYPEDYSKYAFNDLCEVEVYGCSRPGVYGDNCSTPCLDPHCKYCDLDTGTCRGGCYPGYQGHTCELECAVGFYGDGCQKQCRHCINMMQCHHVNGTCLGGCEPGYKGDNCMQMCDIGTFGLHCNEICGQCQDLNDCLQTNGSCLSGCNSGYQGDLCKTSCPNGTFGLGCVNDCNSTCRGCNNINGLCDTGCYPGWKGIYCHQTCSFGYYGDNCSMNCGYCLNYETCHHINGSCLSGCQSGFQVPLCANENRETEEQKCTSRSPLLRRYAKERMKQLDSIPSMRDTKNLGNSAEATQLTITYREVFLAGPGANKNSNNQNMRFLHESLSCLNTC